MFETLWAESDLVIKINFLILLAMSILTWGVMFSKSSALVSAQKIRKELAVVRKAMQEQGFSSSLANAVTGKELRDLLNTGKESLAYYHENHIRLSLSSSLSDWVETHIDMALNQRKADLSKRLSILASIGSTSPFIGLFGTVWGIYLALIKISVVGNASIENISGPIGEALIMTAFGLGVAIPAVLAFNLFSRTNNKILFELANFSKELKVFMLANAAKS